MQTILSQMLSLYPAQSQSDEKNALTEVIQEVALCGLSRAGFFKDAAFYGGTALRIFYGLDRFSEDLDFSLVAPDADFEATGPYIRSIAAMVLEKGLPPLTCLNVNFPDTTDIKGIKICEQAKGRWTNEWAACPRLNDPNYFWLTGEFTDHELENERNDHWALANGYVAITPTTVDVTAYHFMDELNNWFN